MGATLASNNANTCVGGESGVPANVVHPVYDHLGSDDLGGIFSMFGLISYHGKNYPILPLGRLLHRDKPIFLVLSIENS